MSEERVKRVKMRRTMPFQRTLRRFDETKHRLDTTRAVARLVIEFVLFGLLAAGMLLAAIAAARYLIDDEKTCYFMIGLYCAHNVDVVRWVWKKIGIEKEPEHPSE